MLTAATLGMALYGICSVAWGAIDLVARSRVEALADLGQIAFGLLLVLSAAFVRVVMPGGLALAVGALLGLQALSIHGDVHVAGAVVASWQAVRAAIAALLVGLAFFGARAERKRNRPTAE